MKKSLISMLYALIRISMFYFMCLLYSVMVVARLAWSLVFQDVKYCFTKKERLTAPSVLTSDEYGEHKFMQVNGVKLHYVEKGDKTKPLMLFVHGFPEFWYSWRYQIEEFSEDYRTVAVDLRGYGDSEKPDEISEYRLDVIIEDIRQLVTLLGREKFILCSHDFGAFIGWRFVVKHMDMLEKYIMIGSPSSEVWDKLVTQTWTQFKMSWYIFFFQMPMLPEYAVSLDDMVRFKAMDVDKDELEIYKYVFGQKGAFTGPINYYRANMKLINPDKPMKRPLKFSRGLFLLGENDYFISKESGPLLQKYFVNLDFKIVEGANHFSQQHKPEETNRLIREFLNKK
ncbi:unnamed protein product [Diamesa tonsa]